MKSNKADRYYGAMAHDYEEKRQEQPMWKREDEAIRAVMARMPPHCRVLDVPVGTGRFFPIYGEHGALVVGVDISPDMIAKAEERASAMTISPQMVKGSIFALPYKASSFDLAVCVRLMNWLTAAEMMDAIAELARICSDRVVVSIAQARPMSMKALPQRGLAEVGRMVRRASGRKVIELHTLPAIEAAFEGAGLQATEKFKLHSRPGVWEYVLWSLQKAG